GRLTGAVRMAAAVIGKSEKVIGLAARRRLAGFARTLRDNGFKIGLAETNDALAVVVSPAATRPSTLKPALRALFAGTRSDWERFDEIFDAYWSGRGMRRTQALAGSPPAGRAAALQRRVDDASRPPLGLPDHVERRIGDDGDGSPGGRRGGAPPARKPRPP